MNPSVFLARKIDLTFRQGMQPSQALCASSPEGRAKGWGAFLDICGEIRRGELRSPAGRRGRRPLRGVVSSFKIILMFVGRSFAFCLR